MLFNAYTPKALIDFSWNILPLGKVSFDEEYLMLKGKKRLIFEFTLFSFCFLNLMMAFLMTYFTSPGDIPKDSFWQLKISQSMNAQMKLEAFALSIVEREELLEVNLNYIRLPLQDSIEALSSAPCSISSKCNNENNNTSNHISFYHISERNDVNEVRYCKTCLCFKPDRSHHCKVCNKCILKMDHHCPYIGCCIGYFNYKYFNLLLFYSWLLCLQFLIVYGILIKKTIMNSIIGVFYFNEIMFGIVYIFTIYLLMFSFVLWIFHIYLDIQNLSTFEYVEMNKKKHQSKTVSLFTISFDYKSRYCTSNAYDNLNQVYGDYFILWFIPIPPIYKDKQWNNGINFKLNDRFAQEIIKAI